MLNHEKLIEEVDKRVVGDVTASLVFQCRRDGMKAETRVSLELVGDAACAEMIASELDLSFAKG